MIVARRVAPSIITVAERGLRSRAPIPSLDEALRARTMPPPCTAARARQTEKRAVRKRNSSPKVGLSGSSTVKIPTYIGTDAICVLYVIAGTDVERCGENIA